MALRIRCPHCQQILNIDQGHAGLDIPCPACQQLIFVPVPAGKRPAAAPQTVCPRCKQPVAPGTHVCPACLIDVGTGRRVPLIERMRRRPLRFALTLLGGALVCIVAAIFVPQVMRAVSSPKPPPPTATSGPTVKDIASNDSETWAARLLDARNAADRHAALHEIERLGQVALAPIAERLQFSLTQRGVDVASQLAAIDQLGAGGDTHWLPILREASRLPALRAGAQRAAARLGDAEPLSDLLSEWVEHLQTQLFFARMQELLTDSGEGFESKALDRATRLTQRDAVPIRSLINRSPQLVLDRVLAPYWDSWKWLGNSRGEDFAAAVFEVTLPEKGKLSEGERVRTARRALDRAAQESPPAVRAAAGITLAHNAPQYESLKTRIVTALAAELPAAAPIDQQRATWTIAHLTGQRFGDYSDAKMPQETDRAAVAATLRWAKSENRVANGDLKTPESAYIVPAPAARRIVSVRAQMIRDLLQQLHGGWASAGAAREAWQDANLGHPPELLDLLHPGRDPDYAALVNVMILAAVQNAAETRPQLELWVTAADQPAWVRSLATCTLAALDARAGRPDAGWLAALDADTLAALDSGAPGWEHFARVINAGGPRMLTPLKDSKTFPESARKKLLFAVERASS